METHFREPFEISIFLQDNRKMKKQIISLIV